MKAMREKSTSEFKISLDDEIVDPDDTTTPSKKTETVKKRGTGKNGRNLSWIVFVLVALIAAAMVFGYMDIRNRLLSFHSTGSQETRHLSEDLQSKFSTLSAQFSTLEESVKGLIESGSALNASVSSLDEALKKADKSIAEINSSKADKKSLDKALKDIEKRLSPLPEEVKKVAADTAVMSAKLNAGLTEMNTLSARVTEDLKSLKLVVDALHAEKASKKELLTEIDHIENVLKASGNQSEKHAAELAISIRRLELRIRSLEAKAGISPPPDNQLPDSKPDADAPEKQAPGNSSPTSASPGDLIERDIVQ